MASPVDLQVMSPNDQQGQGPTHDESMGIIPSTSNGTPALAGMPTVLGSHLGFSGSAETPATVQVVREIQTLTMDHRGVPVPPSDTLVPGGQPSSSGASPTKQDLWGEVKRLQSALEKQHGQLKTYVSTREQEFQSGAVELRAQAAEAMKAEVAKAEAMVKANYQSTLMDASQQIQTREASLNQMRIALDTSRTQAEEALKQQKVQMTAEIKFALDQQRADLEKEATNIFAQRQQATVEEAKEYLNQNLANEKAEAEKVQFENQRLRQQMENDQLEMQKLREYLANTESQAQYWANTANTNKTKYDDLHKEAVHVEVNAEGDLLQKESKIKHLETQVEQLTILCEKTQHQASEQIESIRRNHQDQIEDKNHQLRAMEFAKVNQERRTDINQHAEQLNRMTGDRETPSSLRGQSAQSYAASEANANAITENMRNRNVLEHQIDARMRAQESEEQLKRQVEQLKKEAEEARKRDKEREKAADVRFEQIQTMMKNLILEKEKPSTTSTSSTQFFNMDQSPEPRASAATEQEEESKIPPPPSPFERKETSAGSDDDDMMCRQCNREEADIICEKCYKPTCQKCQSKLKQEWCKKCVVRQAENPHAADHKEKIKEAEEVVFDNLPHPRKFKNWKLHVKKKIMSASGVPKTIQKWIKKIDAATCIEDLLDDEGYETLSYKIAAGLIVACHGEFKRNIELMEAKLEKKGESLNGRQLLFLVYEHYKLQEVDAKLFDFNDLLGVHLKGDNLVALVNDFEATLDGMAKEPDEDVKCNLFTNQIELSDQLHLDYKLYKKDMLANKTPFTYQSLLSMVKNYIEEKRKDALKRKMAGAPLPGMFAGDGKKKTAGDCHQMQRKGKCSRGDKCPYNHDGVTKQEYRRKGKNGKDRSRSKSRPRSYSRDKDRKGSRGRSGTPRPGSRDRRGSRNSFRGSSRPKGKIFKGRDRAHSRGPSPSGGQNKRPCMTFLKKGKCGDSNCKRWHIPNCVHFNKPGGCRDGKDCIFMHSKGKRSRSGSRQSSRSSRSSKSSRSSRSRSSNSRSSRSSKSSRNSRNSRDSKRSKGSGGSRGSGKDKRQKSRRKDKKSKKDKKSASVGVVLAETLSGDESRPWGNEWGIVVE